MAGNEAFSKPEVKDELAELMATDYGARRPEGAVGRLLFGVALAWSLFQVYIASPLPFLLGFLLLNDQEARSLHLAFAIFLGFAAFPAFRHSPRRYIPWYDWALLAAGTFAAAYIYLFYGELSRRSGTVVPQDIVIAAIGFFCLFEATRRAVGLPLVIVSLLFIAFAFLGPYMPDVVAHRGASLNRVVDHLWLSTEGVFGIALGISASFVFLFVLFGALLDRAGAGNYFIQLSFALLGHMRGGPAKAAVVSSALTGLISGSAIANVVTTGTFTIPLMKRVGFTAERAAAVETSSSINGQIMPPVMGAAAFLMTEFVGISYFEVVKHAFIPAVISYIALFYIVHLEAVKNNLMVLSRPRQASWLGKLIAFAASCAGLVILSWAVYYGIGWIKDLFGEQAGYVIGALTLAVYLGLLWNAARYPELVMDDPNAPLLRLPDTLPTLMAGLHYLIPVVVLVWCLMVERLSPGLSVYWAIIALFLILLTQRPLTNLFRGRGGLGAAFLAGCQDLIQGMVMGARNMVGIAIAMAAAGIIVGVVSLTGLGLLMTEVVAALAGDSLMLMLFLTALISLVLGMGLPTTANYIVVSAIMAPVVVTLAAQGGLVVPLIAVHLFIFYFGLLSGTTPPVALDAFAGAAVARADPLKTCVISFFYSIRTAILPFIFIFNTDLLLIGITSWWHLLMVLVVSTIAMLLFAAATQGWFLTRSRLYESALLLLVSFTLLRPGLWVDQIYPPFMSVDAARIHEHVAAQPPDALMRLWVSGENFSGDPVRKLVVLPLGQPAATGEERLRAATGMEVQIENGKVLVSDLRFNSPAERAGLDFDWEIEELQIPTARPNKEWLYIPAFLLLGLVMLLQYARMPGGGRRRPARTADV